MGIDHNQIEILGKLSDLYVEVSQFSIQPFLAWADQKPEFLVDFGEVEKMILFLSAILLPMKLFQKASLRRLPVLFG